MRGSIEDPPSGGIPTPIPEHILEPIDEPIPWTISVGGVQPSDGTGIDGPLVNAARRCPRLAYHRMTV